MGNVKQGQDIEIDYEERMAEKVFREKNKSLREKIVDETLLPNYENSIEWQLKKQEQREDKRFIELNKHVHSLEPQISSLTLKILEMEKEKSALQVEKNTVEFLRTIYNLTVDNTMQISLSDIEQTESIGEKFYASEKEFLVFENIFMIFRQWISLVVGRTNRRINCAHSQLTVDDLEMYAPNLNNFDSAFMRVFTNSSMYPLARELDKIAESNYYGSKIIPFACPCLLESDNGGEKMYIIGIKFH